MEVACCETGEVQCQGTINSSTESPTDQFVAGILSNHSHLHTAGHTSFHAQQHKALCHRADPARLKNSHPLHICHLAAPLSLRTQSCTHIGDPPQTTLLSRFSAHDSLRDMAIKTDGISVVQDLLNPSAAETKTWYPYMRCTTGRCNALSRLGMRSYIGPKSCLDRSDLLMF